MPLSLLALAAGAFGIGTTEFIIMGLLTQVSQDLHISIPTAGTLISGYAIGVAVGAPVLTLLTRQWPRKRLLLALMLIFIAGNLAAAFAPSYAWLMSARVLTSLTHGTFFGVGAVVATGLVPVDKKASAIALMFSGLTLATLLGVPAGAWIGQMFGWRSAFLAVAVIGVLAFAILAAFVPRDQGRPEVTPLAQELAVLANGQVWLGLGITAFGFAGVFALYTYVEPLLTQVTHMGDSLVALTLLLFGAGLAAGNLLGGKLADRGVMRALVWSIVALMLVLASGRWAFGHQAVAMAYVIVLGIVAFATVAPMQMRVLEQAGPHGANLVSSLNIAAFNLGNALGAWAGGMALAGGLGLVHLGWTAAALTAVGLVLVFWSSRLPAAATQGAGVACA
ncbi:Inner membrane transport protein ydhP [Delftia tsuruhatensis]|uniref:MFS transporter n=1 Tax=Delftia tsuruhatensis TaxID=180282 RepID=UPI001E6CFF64|nr:MFS transporter [Delftia tsuruhatensis]CAB5715285.1 Inner membrane transport protein ydhP [Delftia tsuruhatensis]CAC9676688.1 Inner membrane transport protein ydhP [Delftia tsuruhatensis]